MAWTKPHTFQLDDLETLGNAGLNWDTLAPLVSPPSLIATPHVEHS